jgi:hypothetical protein
MKGLEEAPMADVEGQLRDAFGAAAGTITVQDLPGLPAPASRNRATRRPWAWAPRLRMQVLVPVAAAAAVAVIVVAATAVVPRLLPGQTAARGGSGLAGGPKFFAGVTSAGAVVNIYGSATGRVVASLRPPMPYHDFVAVSRLGGDRTYVVAAITAFSQTACTSHLFRFSIDGQGHPSELTPLSVPQVAAPVAELVSSADGKALAFTASECPRGRQAAGVINLATRLTTTWIVPHHGHQPVSFGSLSLTEDGSKLGFAVGDPAGPAGVTNAYVLATDSPSGPLMQHARKVLHVPTGVIRVVLNSNGSRAYVETLAHLETRPTPRGDAVVLGEYSTTTGHRVRLIGQLRPAGRFLTGFAVTLDAAGKHLLAYGDFHRVTAVNLTTGHQASITAAQIPYLDGAYNTAAW